jgi:hypothetical protein
MPTTFARKFPAAALVAPPLDFLRTVRDVRAAERARAAAAGGGGSESREAQLSLSAAFLVWIDAVRTMVHHKMLNFVDGANGESAAHYAARRGATRLMQVLLTPGPANIFLNSRTAVQVAPAGGTCGMYGASPHVRNLGGWSPLHCAAAEGHSTLVSMLLTLTWREEHRSFICDCDGDGDIDEADEAFIRSSRSARRASLQLTPDEGAVVSVHAAAVRASVFHSGGAVRVREEVSVLFTVTFHANLAHSLTRSP